MENYMKKSFKFCLFSSVALRCLQIDGLAMNEPAEELRELNHMSAKKENIEKSLPILESQEKKMDEEEKNATTRVKELLEKNSDILNSSQGQDIVVVFGNTGAGKSTLINYLSKKELEVDD